MFKEYRESYVTKFSSPFAAYLHDALMNGFDLASWGNATDGPGHVSWIGGRHVLLTHDNGYVEHIKLPAWDGWRYLDRPAKSKDITGAYVWSWIESELPGIAAWELDEEEQD